MRTNSDTFKHTDIHIPSVKEIKARAKKAISGQGLADAALVGSTVALFGVIVFSFTRALSHVSYFGSAPF